MQAPLALLLYLTSDLTCAGAAVGGEAVADRTDAAEAPSGVDTAVDAEAARLSQRKQAALVHIWRNQEGAPLKKRLASSSDCREWTDSPVQTALSKPEMVKPTSQVQRVEPWR